MYNGIFVVVWRDHWTANPNVQSNFPNNINQTVLSFLGQQQRQLQHIRYKQNSWKQQRNAREMAHAYSHRWRTVNSIIRVLHKCNVVIYFRWFFFYSAAAGSYSNCSEYNNEEYEKKNSVAHNMKFICAFWIVGDIVVVVVVAIFMSTQLWRIELDKIRSTVTQLLPPFLFVHYSCIILSWLSPASA